MLIDQSSVWSGTLLPELNPASRFLPEERNNIEQVLRTAADAASFQIALAFERRGQDFCCVGCIGPLAEAIELRVTREVPQFGSVIALVGEPAADAVLPFHQLWLAGKPLPYSAIGVEIMHGDDTGGMLVVANDIAPAFLNAAQNYVLQAHAAHLSTLFKMNAMRRTVLDGSDAIHQSRLERLRLLESVAIHARDSIIITEAEPVNLPGPRILYCNAAFERATGYKAEEAIGQTPRMLQGPKTDPETRARLRQAFADWKPIEVELVNYRKDGSEFWVELSIVPVANEKGWYTHWVSVQRDVSERKQAEELATRVRIAEAENQVLSTEIVERRRVEEELLYTAFHDSLTRLRNRAFFMDRLTSALERAQNGQSTGCAVLFMDLDRFKIVNDSLGHIAGDTLLKEIARRLRSCVRPNDTLARIGGDEFAILMEDIVDLSVTVDIAERIIEVLRAPIRLGRQDVFASCSIGIVKSSKRSDTPEALIRDADIAMYTAKRAGYGDYAIFDESMLADTVTRLSLQTDLRLAIDRKEFRLMYQPVVDCLSRKVVGFEALLRWQHPTRGLVLPGEFVGVAEEIGVIRQIDRWVMHEACAQLADWNREFVGSRLKMSINTSASEFTDPDFVKTLKSVLDQHALEPNLLELEITEGIFLNASTATNDVIDAIRVLGVRIALDDFGTGYSSLSYVNRYPIDTIKIDKSFVDAIRTSAPTRSIVELIVQLGRSLNVAVVAEGVETGDQADLLASMNCPLVQGFYYDRPLEGPAATQLLLATVA